MSDGGVYLRLDEVTGSLWVGGSERLVWEVVRTAGRLGVTGEVRRMGRRWGIGEIWELEVMHVGKAREFVDYLGRT